MAQRDNINFAGESLSDNAGNFGMGAKFEDFETALCSYEAAMQDPLYKEILKRWDDPAGKGVGKRMMRDLYETIDLSAPVHDCAHLSNFKK